MGARAVLLIIALVLFALAAVGVVAARFNLLAAGLFCVTLAELLGGPRVIP